MGRPVGARGRPGGAAGQTAAETGTAGKTSEVIARFDVRDKRVERGTRVDIRGSQVVEDRRTFAETLRAYLAR